MPSRIENRLVNISAKANAGICAVRICNLIRDPLAYHIIISADFGLAVNPSSFDVQLDSYQALTRIFFYTNPASYPIRIRILGIYVGQISEIFTTEYDFEVLPSVPLKLGDLLQYKEELLIWKAIVPQGTSNLPDIMAMISPFEEIGLFSGENTRELVYFGKSPFFLLSFNDHREIEIWSDTQKTLDLFKIAISRTSEAYSQLSFQKGVELASKIAELTEYVYLEWDKMADVLGKWNEVRYRLEKLSIKCQTSPFEEMTADSKIEGARKEQCLVFLQNLLLNLSS